MSRILDLRDTETLSEWLAAHYDLPRPLQCRLLRSYTNNVYLVEASGTRSILKVYGAGWRTEDEVQYEIALLRHLIARGTQVPAPIAGRDGGLVRSLVDEDGAMRQAALFEYVPGEKPQPPFSPELYVAFGRAVGRMHVLSTDFVCEYPRRPLGLTYLIDEPLRLALPLLDDASDRAFLTDLAGRVKARITAFAADGLDWGPIHGDATLDNLHVTLEGEVALYDFDSGGPGWRAADLQGWAVLSSEYAEKGEAFRRGYAAARPLNPVDVQAAPALTLAWDIWGLKVEMERRILPLGREPAQVWLREQLLYLAERAGKIVPEREP